MKAISYALAELLASLDATRPHAADQHPRIVDAIDALIRAHVDRAISELRVAPQMSEDT